MFEEVKEIVRELPERVDERVGSLARRGPLRRMRRFHPMMVEELMFHPAFVRKKRWSGGSVAGVLSLMRDELPWFYEPGIELYRALRTGKKAEIQRAKDNLMAVAELTRLNSSSTLCAVRTKKASSCCDTLMISTAHGQ